MKVEYAIVKLALRGVKVRVGPYVGDLNRVRRVSGTIAHDIH